MLKNILILLIVVASVSAFANTIETSPITVDGQFSRPLTQAEKLKLMRKKLERQNEQMIRKKIAKIRMMNELRLQKQLEALMNKQLQAIDQIN